MDLLLLEDDEDLGQAVHDHLVGAGHRLQWCRRIADAETAAPWAMALLDLHLGDGDGLDLLRRWRQAGRRQPVIVLTARDQVSDRIRGLQAGADDYLVKPFDLDELLARVDAVARRTGPATTSTTASATTSTTTSTTASTTAPTTRTAAALATTAPPLAAGTLRLDTLAHSLWRDGQRIDLTQMEWAVLDCLAQRSGRIYSRGEIEDRLHQQGLADASSNSLEVIVSRLRKKLGADAISTHRGLGYRLEA